MTKARDRPAAGGFGAAGHPRPASRATPRSQRGPAGRAARGLATALAGLLAAAGAALPAAAADESVFLQAAGQANLAAMPDYFAGVGEAHGPLLQELRAGFDARFVARSERLTPDSGSALVDGLVAAFRAYWTDALLDPGRATAAAAGLERAVGDVLRTGADGTDTADDPFEAATRAAAAAGFGASITTAPPLHDLIVWANERRARYRVHLTDGAETVEVVFIDGLVSQGWRHFASLGLDSTSGWTDGGELYCVSWAYDTGSEDFRVSYLKHEARHVADFRRFPGLDETTMEYRAKLTELAYAGLAADTLLRRFAAARDANGTSAHARANDRVARDVGRELFGAAAPASFDPGTVLHGDRINAAARRLLQRNTRELERGSGGPATGG